MKNPPMNNIRGGIEVKANSILHPWFIPLNARFVVYARTIEKVSAVWNRDTKVPLRLGVDCSDTYRGPSALITPTPRPAIILKIISTVDELYRAVASAHIIIIRQQNRITFFGPNLSEKNPPERQLKGVYNKEIK